MTEAEFYQRISEESWVSEDDNSANCVYCHRFVYRSDGDTHETHESFPQAAARIEHGEGCPVLYARERLSHA